MREMLCRKCGETYPLGSDAVALAGRRHTCGGHFVEATPVLLIDGESSMPPEVIFEAAKLAQSLARSREAAHAGHASSRPLSPDYEAIGLFGEIAFAFEFRFRVDRETRPAGDGGVDFVDEMIGTIDVKTARKAFNLIVEHDHVQEAADVLVLCQFNGFDRAPTFVGWTLREEIELAPKKDFGHGIINNYIPAEKLYKMNELKSLLAHRARSA